MSAAVISGCGTTDSFHFLYVLFCISKTNTYYTCYQKTPHKTSKRTKAAVLEKAQKRGESEQKKKEL